MKQLLMAVLFFIISSANCFSQLSFSTVGQVYNFEVGDTFETVCVFSGDCPNYYANQTYVRTVLTKYSDGITLRYEIKTDRQLEGSWSCQLQGSTTSYTDYYVYTDLDSSIFWYHTYAPQGYDSFTYFIDSAYIDSSINNRKANEHFEGSGANFRYDTIYGEGLGEISDFFGDEDFDLTQGNCNLVYYHKASGEIWGSPLKSVVSGINNLSPDKIEIELSPNPCNSILNFNAWGTPIESVSLYSIDGKLLQRGTQPPIESMDVSKFSPGIYIAQIITPLGASFRRWVKL